MNILWKHLWISDKNYVNNIKLDYTIQALVQSLLLYGFFFQRNIWNRRLFHPTKYSINTNMQQHQYLIGFYAIEMFHRSFLYFRPYMFRTELNELYFSKAWILRFANTVIVCFFRIKPMSPLLIGQKIKKQIIPQNRVTPWVENEWVEDPTSLKYFFFAATFFAYKNTRSLQYTF